MSSLTQRSRRTMLAIICFLLMIGFGSPLLAYGRERMPQDWPAIGQVIAYGLAFGLVFGIAFIVASLVMRVLGPPSGGPEQ